MSLRLYQAEALDGIGSLWRQGIKKVLLKAPTGAGKTVIFCEAIKRTINRNKKAVMIVRGRQLVDQASNRLFREQVSHGVRMASHWNKNYAAPVQICSVDTLIARQHREPFPDADLVVYDEAHLLTSNSCKELAEYYNNRGAYTLAVTATPYTRESLRHLADEVVSTITMQDLISQNYLVPAKYYAPSTPDLKGVRTQNGDWVTEQLEERMSVLTGDIVSHWKKLSEGRPTLAFAVNIKHSLALVAQFNSAGIPAEHVEGNHSFSERLAAIKRLETGETKVISNVGVFCTGVDVPFLSCLLMARPTKSYNLFIQQAGRGTRIHSGKENFILLDHAGNTLRHGFITDEPEVCLDGYKKEPRGAVPHLCEKCYTIFTGPVCHVCGWSKPVAPPTEKEMEIEEGILAELKELPQAVEVSIFIRRCKEIAKKQGYKRSWTFYQVRDKFGEDVARTAFPNHRVFNSAIPWIMR